MMGDIEVIVSKPSTKAIIVVDKETGKLLLFTMTYNKKILPGKYNDPDDIVEIFKQLATRGHETKGESIDPMLVYTIIAQILKSDLPYQDKIRELYKYIRNQK